jgi:multidrug efflux pump subunit AcrB
MVRNSVLLIDFINLRLSEGVHLNKAIVEAGAIRITPILLTAGAVAFGALIILFDPIISRTGDLAYGRDYYFDFLTLIVIPLLYYRLMRNKK